MLFLLCSCTFPERVLPIRGKIREKACLSLAYLAGRSKPIKKGAPCPGAAGDLSLVLDEHGSQEVMDWKFYA